MQKQESHDFRRGSVKLGVSTYSYWHFKPERVPIEHVIEEAARLELDGIEILHQAEGLKLKS